MNDSTTVTRQQLYEMVWKKSMSQLSKDFGISDVGLAKLCARHRVPTPPRGYWALLEVGKAPPKPALPAKGDARSITIHRSPPRELPPETVDALRSAKKAEKAIANRIVVQEKLRATHAVVITAKEALQNTEPNEIGILSPNDCHAVRVTRAQRSRGLRILEALVDAFEGRCWRVTLDEGKTRVRVDDVSISVRVVEETERVERQAKADLSGSYSFHFKRHDKVDKPCGRLAVEIEEEARLWGSNRRRWHDTEKHMLEDQLNDVVIGLLKLADAVRAYLAKRQREEQETQDRERKIDELLGEQARLRKLLAKEKADLARLRDQAVRWKESQAIRDLVVHVRAEGRLREEALEGQAIDGWCAWALQQADRLDPFAESPPSILDRADQIEHMSDGIPTWRLR